MSNAGGGGIVDHIHKQVQGLVQHLLFILSKDDSGVGEAGGLVHGIAKACQGVEGGELGSAMIARHGTVIGGYGAGEVYDILILKLG